MLRRDTKNDHLKKRLPESIKKEFVQKQQRSSSIDSSKFVKKSAKQIKPSNGESNWILDGLSPTRESKKEMKSKTKFHMKPNCLNFQVRNSQQSNRPSSSYKFEKSNPKFVGGLAPKSYKLKTDITNTVNFNSLNHMVT